MLRGGWKCDDVVWKPASLWRLMYVGYSTRKIRLLVARCAIWQETR